MAVHLARGENPISIVVALGLDGREAGVHGTCMLASEWVVSTWLEVSDPASAFRIVPDVVRCRAGTGKGHHDCHSFRRWNVAVSGAVPEV